MHGSIFGKFMAGVERLAMPKISATIGIFPVLSDMEAQIVLESPLQKVATGFPVHPDRMLPIGPSSRIHMILFGVTPDSISHS